MFNTKIKNSSPFINKVSMAVLATLPMLAWYKIPFPVGLGYAFVLFLSTFTILRNRFRINVVPLTFWMVFIYVCFMWMYNHKFELWTLLPPGGWVFFIFFLALLWGIMNFDIRLLKKYMWWVVLISGVLFWIQFACVVTIGSPKFCFVPNLTGEFTYEGFTYADIVDKHMSGGMPCSIFLEKSYLAYYFLSYLALVWFEIKGKNQMFTKETVFVIATLIASRSGTALVGLSVLFAVKMFFMFWSTNVSRRMLLILIVVPMVVGAIYLYVSSEMGQQMLSRTEELSSESTSGFTRVVGGYMMFDQLNLNEQIIGISDAREKFGFERYDGSFVFYVNGVQSILLNLGFVGALFYLLFYMNLFRKVNLSSKMCIIVLLIMGLLESNYLNPYMMLLTIIPCAEVHLKKKKYYSMEVKMSYTN